MNVIDVDTVRTVLLIFGIPFLIWGMIFMVVITVFRILWNMYFDRKHLEDKHDKEGEK